MTDTFTEVEKQAMMFLYNYGPDTMPREIKSEEQMAAVMVFGALERRGMIMHSVDAETLIYRLTPRGRNALINSMVGMA